MNTNIVSLSDDRWLRVGRVLIALVAFFALLTLAAAAAETAAPSDRTAKNGRESLTDEGAAAAPLIHRALTNLDEAVRSLDAGQVDLARVEVAKTQRILGAVRHLLAEPEDRQEQGSIAPSPSQTPARRVPPLSSVAPGKEESWDPWRSLPDDGELFGDLRDMQARIQQLFQDWPARQGRSPGWAAMTFSPDADLADEGHAYVIRFDVPGADKANINVKAEGRVLTVSGKTESVNEAKDKDRVIRSERRSGQFQRVITLPGPVKSDKIEAKCENGVLTITIPKAADDSATKNVPVI